MTFELLFKKRSRTWWYIVGGNKESGIKIGYESKKMNSKKLKF
jgi:hypothetical protein